MKHFILIYSICLSFAVSAQEFAVHASDVYVSPNDSLAVYGGFSLTGEARANNRGTILLRGTEASFINNASDTALYGIGTLALQSTTAQTIGGQYATTSHNLLVDNSSSSGVILENNLSVSNQLRLTRGLVTTNANRLAVSNADENAIVFDDSRSNSSYVVGTLERATNPEKKYVFPVGSAQLYNPVQFISELHNAAAVRASFHADWFTNNQESINLRYYGYLFDDFVKDGAWKLEATAPTAGTFEVNAAIFNFSALDESENGYSLAVKNNNAWQLAGKRSFVDVEENAIQGDYIQAKQNTVFGVFAIAYASMNNLRIVNIIEALKGKETRFIIPEVWKYSNNHLEIYSQWGNVLHESDNYTNSFDFESYPAGTYYYTFHYDRNGKRQVFKSFVEVVR